MQSKKKKKDDSIKRTATLKLLDALELLARLFFFFFFLFETKVRMWKSLSLTGRPALAARPLGKPEERNNTGGGESCKLE